MRRRWLVAGLAIVGFVAGASHFQGQALQGSPRLTVTAQGASMEFQTLGMSPGSFNLDSGESRTWVLKPGRYVVVQAPPIGVATQVGPNEYTIEGGLQIECSDGTSSNQYDLETGDNLTCVFTASP